jgi:hypothetical protein
MRVDDGTMVVTGVIMAMLAFLVVLSRVVFRLSAVVHVTLSRYSSMISCAAIRTARIWNSQAADLLVVSVVPITNTTDAIETTPSLGWDGINNEVVFTRRAITNGVAHPGDIYYQIITSNVQVGSRYAVAYAALPRLVARPSIDGGLIT